MTTIYHSHKKTTLSQNNILVVRIPFIASIFQYYSFLKERKTIKNGKNSYQWDLLQHIQ